LVYFLLISESDTYYFSAPQERTDE